MRSGHRGDRTLTNLFTQLPAVSLRVPAGECGAQKNYENMKQTTSPNETPVSSGLRTPSSVEKQDLIEAIAQSQDGRPLKLIHAECADGRLINVTDNLNRLPHSWDPRLTQLWREPVRTVTGREAPTKEI